MNTWLVIVVVLLVVFIAVGVWSAKCERCGFYRDPERPGCNCPRRRT